MENAKEKREDNEEGVRSDGMYRKVSYANEPKETEGNI